MHFEIVGPLRVVADDQRELALGGEKPAAILAMLLLRPKELVSAEQLIENLSDGRPPATAAKTYSRTRFPSAPTSSVVVPGGRAADAAPERLGTSALRQPNSISVRV